MILDDLRPGSTLFATSDDEASVPIKISSLFRRINDSHLYILAAKPNASFIINTAVSINPSDKSTQIGTIKVDDTFLNRECRYFFAVITINSTLATRLNSHLHKIAYCKNFYDNIYSSSMMRIKKNPPLETGSYVGKRRSNSALSKKRISKGFITGEAVHPTVIIGDNSVTLERAGTARSSSLQRPLAGIGDRGAPVLSRSKALMGFIIGKENREVLILPAEDLAKKGNLEFVATEKFARRARVRV